MRHPRRDRAPIQDDIKVVTVQVFCRESEPAFTVFWEPTGDEFVIAPGERYTFAFKGKEFRSDWPDIAVSHGPDGMYLGGENLNQHQVIKDGVVIWSWD